MVDRYNKDSIAELAEACLFIRRQKRKIMQREHEIPRKASSDKCYDRQAVNKNSIGVMRRKKEKWKLGKKKTPNSNKRATIQRYFKTYQYYTLWSWSLMGTYWEKLCKKLAQMNLWYFQTAYCLQAVLHLWHIDEIAAWKQIFLRAKCCISYTPGSFLFMLKEGSSANARLGLWTVLIVILCP